MHARKLVWIVAATIVKIFLAVSGESSLELEATNGPIDFDALLVQQFEQRHNCCSRTTGYLEQQNLQYPYTSSAFFDCWRSDDEIDTFLTAITAANPQMLSRLPEIAVTAENRSIPAYRLSVRGNISLDSVDAVYVQGLAHAREWQTGSSVVFAVASMIDGLLSNDSGDLEVRNCSISFS